MAVLDTTRASDAADTLANLLWCAKTPVQMLCLSAGRADRDWAKRELARQADEAQALVDQLRDAHAAITAEEGHTIVPSDPSHFQSFAPQPALFPSLSLREGI